MSCVSGKKGYYTESEIIEALIRSQISFRSSATNYYICDDCGEFHLTSRTSLNPILKDPEVKKRIEKERQEQEWTQKFRK